MLDFQHFLSRVSTVVMDDTYRTEIEEELMDHLECAAADLEAQGYEPDEARRRAIEAFGNPEEIAWMLQQTDRGSRRMRAVRLAGVCALMSGATAAVIMRETSLTYMVRGVVQRIFPGDKDGSVVLFLCIALFMFGLLGFMLRHARTKGERFALLAAPVLGPALFALGAVGLGWNLMMTGIFTLGIGLTVAGGFLALRREQPQRALGMIMALAGALPLLFPFMGPHAGQKPLGMLITYTFAAGWMTLGCALLTSNASRPGTPRPIA